MSENTLQPSDLPPVHELQLSVAELGQWIADLHEYAQVLAVATRGAAGYAQLGRGDHLANAAAALQAGQCAALQVRYVFEGAEWVDTAVRTPSGTRLVRLRVVHQLDSAS